MFNNPVSVMEERANAIETMYLNGELDNLYYIFRDTEKRVNKCQAWFVDTGDMLILKSYNTIVAVYDKQSKILFSCGRYTMTTYQHIRKFRNNYTPSMHYTTEANLELCNWF